MINVLLVDDHDLVRAGIKRILTDIGDINILNEAATGEEAVRLVRKQKPDVVIMDVSMPGIGGLEATRKIKTISSRIGVIVVTIYGNDPYPYRLLEAGASGYLTKGCSAAEMVAAIRAVHAGGRYLDAEIANTLALSAVSGSTRSPFDELTMRETQVMVMVTRGQRNCDIARDLCLSPKTVSTYRYRLYDKLGVSNDVELTRLALHHGILEQNPLI